MSGYNSTALARFWAKIQISETNSYDGTPCWEWTGCIHRLGYGQFKPDGRRKHNGGKPQTSPHRFAYEHFVGDIPEDREVDHLCNVKHCANPRHLELVSRQENLSRRNRRYSRVCSRHNEEKVPVGALRSKLACKSCGREAVQRHLDRKKERVR
jgi:hypothetical protein